MRTRRRCSLKMKPWLLLGTIAGTASSVVAYWVVHGGAAESHALRLRLVARVLSLALLSPPLGDFSKG
jgi:hypothetical protein